VSNPDSPVEIPRPVFSRRSEAPIVSEAHEERFHPRYVQLHALRDHGHGPRNLAWGVAILLLALALLGLGLFLVGTKVLLALATCLLTFTALFVLARLHVFRQRNGGFLALGIVVLFGAAMPLIELGYRSLETFARSRTAASSASSGEASASGSSQPMLLTEAFALSAPEPGAGPRIKVTKDAVVAVEGRAYRLKAGDVLALGSERGSEITAAVRDLLVPLPADAVEVISDRPAASATASSATPAPAANSEPAPPANETPAQITQRAQREVIRRYPALGVKNSLENQLFVSTYREIKEGGGTDFFKDPNWPIELAELLAKRERWPRGGGAPSAVAPGPSVSDQEPTSTEPAEFTTSPAETPEEPAPEPNP
jgi:hypothetical protein